MKGFVMDRIINIFGKIKFNIVVVSFIYFLINFLEWLKGLFY